MIDKMADAPTLPYQGTANIPLFKYDQWAFLDDADSDVSQEIDLEELRVASTTGDASSISQSIVARLYVSHFLSTWNSRVFEFGAVLYLATIFPGTLMPISVYAVSRGLAAVLLSPLVGNYIDVGNRLQVVRLSIGESRTGDLQTW